MTTASDASHRSSSSSWGNLTPIGATVHARVQRVQRGYRDDQPFAVAALARLRRGVGQPAHALPDLVGLTGMEALIEQLEDLPVEEREQYDLERAEEALHLTMTLWALHQQSYREADMHVRKQTLGKAVRDLMRAKAGGGGGENVSGASLAEKEFDEPLRRRFVRVGTANALDGLGQRLREIVLLLRRETIPLDYALLADQLYYWQWPTARVAVRRRWSRDFHLANTPRGKGKPPTDPDGPSAPAPSTGPGDTDGPYPAYGLPGSDD